MDLGLSLVQQFVIRRLEDQLALENAGLSADGYSGVGLQSPGQVALAEPYDFNVAGFIAQHRLGVYPPALVALLDRPGFPDGTDHGARFVGRDFRDLGDG